MSYPVLQVLTDVKAALGEHPIVVLQAPPGAGKSTVLPLHLMHESWLSGKKMIMLEPRRLAARAVAHRMASLLEEEPGNSVGYSVRFESRGGATTRIQVVTEGIMNRMIQDDNTLENVGLVIFDEFHERSLQSDLALALCRQIQEVIRPDLRILIMSATLDGSHLAERLNNAPVITSAGRQYPVTFYYDKSDDTSNISLRVAAACRRAMRSHSGDILVFLPGSGEIKRTQQLLEEEHPAFLVLPLYGDLSFEAQQRAILPDKNGRRKVVLATSIAETSLTIEGIAIVIDCGYSRVPRFNPRSGLTRLETVRVTKDSADQRAGRAGRLGPGACYRLWTEKTHQFLLPARRPEIMDADLSTLVLELAHWGVRDVAELAWITPPPAGSVSQASTLLHQLGALDDSTITARGRAMVALPTHPRLAHMLTKVEGDKEQLALAIDCAALLEEKDPLPREYGADLSIRVDALRSFRRRESFAGDRVTLERIERLANHWRRLLKVPPASTPVEHRRIGTLMLDAYSDRVAQQAERQGSLYKLVNGRVARLLPNDPMVSEAWIVAVNLDAGDGEGKIFLAAGIDPADVVGSAVDEEVIRWDDHHERIVGMIESRIGSLVVERRQLKDIAVEKRRRVLCDMIRSKGLAVLGWADSLVNWQARVMSLRKWNGNENWPDVSDERLLETLDDWLGPAFDGVSSRSELQRVDVGGALRMILPWEQQHSLDILAPAKIKVPSGSDLSLKYSMEGEAPVLQVRLQELFGWTETPTVNAGKKPILIHLLSPGYRMVQATSDLRSFWATGYAEVSKELRRRYPKHSWPDDPLTAAPVRGVRKSSRR